MENIIRSPYELSTWEDIPTVEYYDDNEQLIEAFCNKKIITVGDQTIQVAGGNNFLENLEESDTCHAVRYMDEVKSAVIGSDTMDSPIRAYDLVLKQNINGTVTLNFTMNRRYYDEEDGEFKWNPFSNLIVNERKLKLKYKDQWFDLIIKQIDESSDKNTMDIKAESLPINELAKAGYSIEFDTELKNNIGTITDLANTIVENTDWAVCEVSSTKQDDKSDLLEEYLEEALYEIHILTDVTANDIREEVDPITLYNGEMCYAFYSSLYALKNGGTELQILFDRDNNYEIDENNVIVVSDDHNINRQYTISGIEWHEGIEGSAVDFTGIINSDGDYIAIDTGKPETSGIWPSYVYRGEKLVHNTYQVYEPISQKVCTLYHNPDSSDNDIYGYVVSDYNTDDILSNYIGDGDTFEDASSWIDKEASTTTSYNNITHAFWPALESQYTTTDITKINFDMHRYLCIPKVSTSAQNVEKVNTTVQSSLEGLEEGLIKGEQLVFGVSLGFYKGNITTDTYVPPEKPTDVSPDIMASDYQVALVDYYVDSTGPQVVENHLCDFTSYKYGSPYKFEESKYTGYFLERKDELETTKKTDGLYFTYDELNDYYVLFKGTSFESGVTYYVPSTTNRYIYSVGKININLSAAQIESGKRSGDGYSVDKNYKIGLMFMPTSHGFDRYTYIEKIQLFDFQNDGNGEPLFIGSIPTSEARDLYKYFTIPENAVEEADLVPYGGEGSFEPISSLVPYEREYPFEKVRTITGKESNRFNLLQNLCETFECWLRFKIYRDEDTGKIDQYVKFTYDDDGNITQIDKNQHKELLFKKVIGTYNYRGFYYGTNLKQIKRENDSSELVTKLIVGINSNEFGDNGFCTIARSQYNPIKDTVCYNLDYYIKQGMISQEDYILDLTVSFEGHLNYYSSLNQVLNDYEEKSEEVSRLWNSLYDIQSNQKTYSELADVALAKKQDSMDNIKDFLSLPSETSDAVALKKITDEITGDPTLDHSTPISRLTSYRNNCYNYNTYLMLSDYYTQEESIAKAKIVAKQKELDEAVANKKEIENRFYRKYSRFIQEGSWIDEDYYDDDKYYLDAQNVLYDSAFPQVKYTISVLDLDELVGYENYHYELGDITYVEDTEFFGYITKDGLKTPYQEEVLISETTDYLENPEKNVISVQNYKTQFEDLFQRITATTQSLQYASGAYNRTTSVVNLDGTINQQMLSESLQNVLGALSNGIDKTTELNEDGIVSRNLNNKDWLVRFKNGAISTSQDNGINWSDVLTPAGINVNILTAGSINTSNVTIYGGNGGNTFRWDSSNLIAYKSTGTSGYDEKTYAAFNHEGIRVSQNVKDNPVIRVKLGYINEQNTYGFSLYDNEGNQTLWADADSGDLTVEGTIHAEAGYFKNGDIEYCDIKYGTINEAAITNGTIESADITKGTIKNVDIGNCSIIEGTIDKAAITYGTIQYAKITDCEIDSAQIKSLSFEKITSNTYSTMNTASLYCNNLQASGGTIGGWKIGTETLSSADGDVVLNTGDTAESGESSVRRISVMDSDGNAKFIIWAGGGVSTKGNFNLNEGSDLRLNSGGSIHIDGGDMWLLNGYFIMGTDSSRYWINPSGMAKFYQVLCTEIHVGSKTTTGHIYLNGEEIHTSIKSAKKEIEPIGEKLQDVLKTGVYSYVYDGELDYANKSIGFIIGDGAVVDDDIVVYEDDGNPSGINLYSATAIAWKAIQELQQEIDELKKQLNKN